MGKDISAKPNNLRSVPRTLMEERDWALGYTLTCDGHRCGQIHTYTSIHTHNWGERVCVNINIFEELTWINSCPTQLTQL